MEGLEKPRDVYLRSCAEIGAAFEPDGFRYLKSSPEMKREGEPFSDRVGFSSSHHNRPGTAVALSVSFGVRSKEAGRWISARLSPSSKPAPFAAGWDLGQFIRAPLAWDLADAGDRSRVIHDVTGALRTSALPWMEIFHDRQRLTEALIRREILIPVGDLRAVDLLMWLGDETHARLRLRQILDGWDRAAVEQSLWWVEHLRKGGLQKQMEPGGTLGAAQRIVGFDLHVDYPDLRPRSPFQPEVPKIGVTRPALEAVLLRYGEEVAAQRVAALSDEELTEIGLIAWRHRRPGVLDDLALALGSVEFLEGTARDVARPRRR